MLSQVPSAPADAVDVGLRRVREVKVDDVADLLEINATCHAVVLVLVGSVEHDEQIYCADLHFRPLPLANIRNN